MSEQLLKQSGWLSQASTQRIFSLFSQGGFRARVVGGAVRNTLLGQPISDIDFASTARPEQVLALARAAGIKYLPTGLQHGTVTLVVDGIAFEVTTLRKDEQTDGRHAVVAFTDDWAGDAARRDFTVNALYCDADGSLFDPLGGFPDIAKRRIVFIGDADERIREDYLRIFRFFRFYAQYGSGKIDGAGFRACIRGGNGLERVSAERISVELLKLLVAPHAREAMGALYGSGLLVKVFGHVPLLSRFEKMLALEAQLGLEADALLRLAALFVMLPGDIVRLDRRLRLSKRQKTVLGWFAGQGVSPLVGDTALGRLLYYRGAGQVRLNMLRFILDSPDAEIVQNYAQLLPVIDRWQQPVFPVNGKDLMNWGLESGVVLGETLRELETLWVDSGFSLSGKELLDSLEPG